ncbi:MAG: tetratricopeptide repeat protein, partial [Planctomycetota bacterium]
AYAAEQSHRFADAAAAFVALARAEPDRADWLVAAGRCLGQSGQFRAAVDLLDAGRKRFPGLVEVAAMLARTFVLQAELDRGVLQPEVLWTDAVDLAEGVLAVDPNHEDSALVLAQARYQLGQWDKAVAAAEEAVRRHPGRAGAHMLLGRIAGDRLRALLKRHADEQPTGQAAADLVGQIDAQRQLARKSYGEAARLDPTRPRPHTALGELAWLDRRPDEARNHFADALAVDPDAPIDHDALWAGQGWEARAAFYAAVRHRYAATTNAQPAKAATLRFHEGRARSDGGEWQAARTCLAEALAGNPAATNAHFYLFLCAYNLGDHDAAELHGATYAALGAPTFADVIRGLAGDRRGQVGAVVEFLANRAFASKHIEASRDLNHVIACLKDSADAWNNHALLCRDTGRFDDALASYQHAMEKEPDSPQLLNDTGVILHYHLRSPANAQKARELYGRAVRLAEAQLADDRLQGAARERVARAKDDALANLKELGGK